MGRGRGLEGGKWYEIRKGKEAEDWEEEEKVGEWDLAEKGQEVGGVVVCPRTSTNANRPRRSPPPKLLHFFFSSRPHHPSPLRRTSRTANEKQLMPPISGDFSNP